MGVVRPRQKPRDRRKNIEINDPDAKEPHNRRPILPSAHPAGRASELSRTPPRFPLFER